MSDQEEEIPQKKVRQTSEGKALRKKLYDQVMQAFIMEGVNPNAIADIAGLSLRIVYGIKKNRDMTTYNLARILDAMGYEMKVTKIVGRPPMCDDPLIAPKIKHFNEKQLYAKRKERNQPTKGPLPAKIRVKRTRGEKYNIIISRRSIENEERQKFTDGGNF